MKDEAEEERGRDARVWMVGTRRGAGAVVQVHRVIVILALPGKPDCHHGPALAWCGWGGRGGGAEAADPPQKTAPPPPPPPPQPSQTLRQLEIRGSALSVTMLPVGRTSSNTPEQRNASDAAGCP